MRLLGNQAAASTLGTERFTETLPSRKASSASGRRLMYTDKRSNFIGIAEDLMVDFWRTGLKANLQRTERRTFKC